MIFFNHPRRHQVGYALLIFGLVTTATTETGRSQALKSRAEIDRVAVVEKLNIQEGVVSGEVVNKSPNLLRNVQLFIRYTWLWDDERKPGKIDPSTSTLYALPKEIPSGGRLPFTFSPKPPLPKLAGGRFETSVSIAGYAELIPRGS